MTGTSLLNIVVGGGPCACNPEPLADFFDIFFLGDGEEVDIEVMELYRQCKKEGKSKLEFLEQAAQIEGVYVPAFYDVTYNEDGTVKAVHPHPRRPCHGEEAHHQGYGQGLLPQRLCGAPHRRGAQPHL